MDNYLETEGKQEREANILDMINDAKIQYRETNGYPERYHIVYEYERFDISTDGYLGQGKKITFATNSLDEAEKFLAEELKKYGCENEEEYYQANHCEASLNLIDTKPEPKPVVIQEPEDNSSPDYVWF